MSRSKRPRPDSPDDAVPTPASEETVAGDDEPLTVLAVPGSLRVENPSLTSAELLPEMQPVYNPGERRWEYLSVWVPRGDSFAAKANEYGALGWELISVQEDHPRWQEEEGGWVKGVTAYFKRRLT